MSMVSNGFNQFQSIIGHGQVANLSLEQRQATIFPKSSGLANGFPNGLPSGKLT
jgi:hypothetical protein